jgi:uncharacterized protein (TIGR03435 family)
MTRALLFFPLVIAANSAAQTAPPLAFDVATVKLMDANNPHPPSVNISGDRFAATGMTLKELVKIAYDLNYGTDQQISGGPAWFGSTRFDVEAKVDESLSVELQKHPEERGPQIRQMLRGLLTERFKLTVHHQSVELPIYEMVMAKSGSKLMPSIPPSSPDPKDPATKPRSWIRFAGKGLLEGNNADAPTLVTVLSMQPELGGRLVVDKTGLKGKYDFTLKWTPETGQSGETQGADTGPSLFTALQEELGVKLQSTKAPVDTIVIDHVELPAAN